MNGNCSSSRSTLHPSLKGHAPKWSGFACDGSSERYPRPRYESLSHRFDLQFPGGRWNALRERASSSEDFRPDKPRPTPASACRDRTGEKDFFGMAGELESTSFCAATSALGRLRRSSLCGWRFATSAFTTASRGGKAIGDSLRPTRSMTELPATKNALGPALREARLARGWTLPRLADHLRVNGLVCTAKRLGRIEAQQGAIRDFEVLYFCEALGVTHEELWKRREYLLAHGTVN